MESDKNIDESDDVPILPGHQIERDISHYSQPIDGPNSSDDEDGEAEGFEDDESVDPDQLMPYEIVGNGLTGDDDSDTEYGEFSNCTDRHEVYNGIEEVKSTCSYSGEVAEENGNVVLVSSDSESETGTLPPVPPRNPIRSIPPLSEEKIASIKRSMLALNLRPNAGAESIASMVISARPRLGDELQPSTESCDDKDPNQSTNVQSESGEVSGTVDES